MSSPYASVQNSFKIHEALEVARANDRMMSSLRCVAKSPSPVSSSNAAGKQQAVTAVVSPEMPVHAAAAMLTKFSRSEALERPEGAHRHVPSPGSSLAALKNLGKDHQRKAVSGSTGSWQPAVISMGSSVAFTKWLHLQHKYETCQDSMGNGLASENASTESTLGKRARSEKTVEIKESAFKAASPAFSDDASASHVTKIAKTSEPSVSPLHSVTKAPLEDILYT